MAETEMKWYVMRSISGKESKVKQYADAMLLQQEDFAKHVSQILIPTEKVVTINRNNKRVVKERNHLPGYVLVECELVGEIQSKLRNIPRIRQSIAD